MDVYLYLKHQVGENQFDEPFIEGKSNGRFRTDRNICSTRNKHNNITSEPVVDNNSHMDERQKEPNHSSVFEWRIRSKYSTEEEVSLVRCLPSEQGSNRASTR